jgi:hypothetical protein
MATIKRYSIDIKENEQIEKKKKLDNKRKAYIMVPKAIKTFIAS